MVTAFKTASANGNGDCAGKLDSDLSELLEKLAKTDADFVRVGFSDGTYQVRIGDYWMVVRSRFADEFDFMRLDRALRSRITEQGWHYGLGLMSSAVLHGRLARICIPPSSTQTYVESCPLPFIPRPLWIWASHPTEDAIALLRAYVTAVEKIEERLNVSNAA
ncbi:hypothetical protein [Allocoleopsis sp.]|uniref:hypothetical protein n=1 Tax=Allocoleopsis sp. TaxID=3088169 RepID=UPI002FD3537A